MTYEQYWYGDPQMVGAFRKLRQIRQEQKDYDDWRLCAYVYDTLGRIAPILQAFAKDGTKALPYIERPYGMKKREEDRSIDEETELALAESYMSQFVRAGKNWGKSKEQ